MVPFYIRFTTHVWVRATEISQQRLSVVANTQRPLPFRAEIIMFRQQLVDFAWRFAYYCYEHCNVVADAAPNDTEPEFLSRLNRLAAQIE